MKRLYLILSGLIFICTPLGVYATGKDSSAYISDWNATEMETCKNSSNVGAATIGTLKNNCTGSTKDESCALSTGSNNEYRRGLIMMVAHTITANGAYFCPTVVAANKKKRKIHILSTLIPHRVAGVCGYANPDSVVMGVHKVAL